jgi:hypothetical protein
MSAPDLRRLDALGAGGSCAWPHTDAAAPHEQEGPRSRGAGGGKGGALAPRRPLRCALVALALVLAAGAAAGIAWGERACVCTI